MRKSKFYAYVMIIVLILLLCSGCNSKSAKLREQTYGTLSFLEEELSAMSDNCHEAYLSGDYEEMEGVLYDMYERCMKLERTARDLANRYADRDYD